MAPSPRTGSRQDATALPSMSSTFWAFMILAGLLVAYCSQLAAGTCEIVTLDRDSSQPRRTIARQTARCACRKGQIAGTTRARPACVDGPAMPGADPSGQWSRARECSPESHRAAPSQKGDPLVPPGSHLQWDPTHLSAVPAPS
ncbi:chemokine-like protein TAFA-5 isoform X1 [Manis pentadactyla]|uniref:chemokine-like protein TAFA-5 isoform X1 n=1 Tax=Manis pentadactyla TaxID=143292 RepID=UPI00255C562B|nr:chemokine-like protein TAFA-5 isoform X1 [Manis pentadactyla]